MKSVRHFGSLIAGIVLLASALPARALVVGSSIDNLDGTYTYSYVVDNTGGAFDISLWSLDFDFALPDWDQLDSFSGGSVLVPSADWFASAGIPLTGLSAQDFLSLSPLGDVTAGTSLGGFSFKSTYAPGLVGFAEFDASGASSTQGTTVGPSAGVAHVPEGNPFPVAAAVILAGLAWRSRRSPRSAR